MKDCNKRGKDILIGGVKYHECCHEDRSEFVFCENAIEAKRCPGEL